MTLRTRLSDHDEDDLCIAALEGGSDHSEVVDSTKPALPCAAIDNSSSSRSMKWVLKLIQKLYWRTCVVEGSEPDTEMAAVLT